MTSSFCSHFFVKRTVSVARLFSSDIAGFFSRWDQKIFSGSTTKPGVISILITICINYFNIYYFGTIDLQKLLKSWNGARFWAVKGDARVLRSRFQLFFWKRALEIQGHRTKSFKRKITFYVVEGRFWQVCWGNLGLWKFALLLFHRNGLLAGEVASELN